MNDYFRARWFQSSGKPASVAGINRLTFAVDPATGAVYEAMGGMASFNTQVTLERAGQVFTVPMAFAAGAVGTPSITFAGGLSNGFYYPVANTIGVVCNGAIVAGFSPTGMGVWGMASVTLLDAVNNDVSEAVDVLHATSGVPANNIGSAIALRVETAHAPVNTEVAAQIAGVVYDVTAAHEDSRMRVRVLVDGTLTSVMEVGSDGFALVRDIGGAHVANGMIGVFHLAQAEGNAGVVITNSYVKVGAVVILQLCAVDALGVTQITCPVATVAGQFTVTTDVAVAAIGGLDVSFVVVNPLV